MPLVSDLQENLVRNKLSRCRCGRRVLLSHIVVLVFQALVASTPSERQRSLKRPGRKAKTQGDTKKGDQRGQQRIVVVERWKC